MDKRITPDIVAAAQRSQAKYYVPASVSIAQWAVESAWGRSLSGKNNPFGIKAIPGHAHTSRMTREVLGGVSKMMPQDFADFADIAEAFDEHGKLFQRVSLYHPAIQAWLRGDLVGGVRLMAEHYATDPHYAATIMSVINSNGLAAVDKLAPASQAAPSAASPILTNAAKAADPHAQPSSGPSPAPASASSAADNQGNIMGNLLGSVASVIEGVLSKGTTVATVATVAPTIIQGAFRSIDEAERGFKALSTLAADVRGGKWDHVGEDVTAIFTEFRKIMVNFGIDHDKLNASAAKVAELDSIKTLKAKAA